MSEQQPLISPEVDTEAQSSDLSCRGEGRSFSEKAASYLESFALHKTVIALITIDACCVLADLAYTFLSDTCPPSDSEGPPWLQALAHISLAITTLFLIEIPLNLWAFGLQYYNPFGGILHASLHFLDSIIIMITFLLEVFLKGRERELAGLLVILRFWRLIKLVGGITVGAGEVSEETLKQLRDTRKELEDTRIELKDAQDQIRILKGRISMLEGER